MLERNSELDAIGRRIDGLRGADALGACVLVHGEAGVGKTTLAAEAARRAGPAALWLRGTCEPMLSPLPFGPLLDLVDGLPLSLAAAVRAGRQASEVMAGMLGVLRDRATPVVLEIDDAQWADGATLDLLRYLGRRIESTRAILMLGFRDDALGPDHPLRHVLAGLPARATLRIGLRPLSRAAVAELAQRAGRSARGLYEATLGNPFFVDEVLACEAGELPAAVRDAVLARAAPLGAAAREVLELVSVAPAELEIEAVESILAGSGAAIASCVDAGLLVSQGATLRFRHELARQSLFESIAPARVARLHAAVFGVLSKRGAAPGRLVHHADAAGLGAEVLRLAPLAASTAASASDHRQAAALYGLASVHAGAMPARRRAELLVARSDECMLTSEIVQAIEARAGALALHRELGDPIAIGADLRALARLDWFRGDIAAGIGHAQAAIDALEPLPDARRELAMAYATMAQLHLLGETSQPAGEWGRKALDLLETLGDAEGLAYALNTVGTAELRNDPAPAGWLGLERSLSIALEHGFEEHAARAYTNLASLALVHRRGARLDRACADGIAYCEARDLDMYVSRLRIRQAYGLLGRGRWREAAAMLGRVREAAPLTPLEDEQSAHVAALLALRRGEPDSADYWRALIAGERSLSVDPWYAPQAVARAEAAWLRGADAAVAAIADAALPAALRSGERWRIGQLLCWRQRVGAPPTAYSGALPLPCELELAGDWRAAAAAWQALDSPYERGLALLGGNEASLRDALLAFESLGAAPAARIARRRLRALGARHVARGPYAPARRDPEGLTARERVIHELLLQGLSNKAIAARLQRSERTVEHHVSALLAKLGARSRTEAIARAGARGAEI